MSDYTSSIPCSDGGKSSSSGPLSVTVGSGEAAVCTITNTYVRATVGNSTTQTWTIHDFATLTNLRGGSTSTLTFKLFGPSNATCTDSGSVGPGSYIYSFVASLTAAQNGTVSLDTTGVGTTAGSNVVSKVGTCRWRVSFSGNAFNNSFEGTCGEETTTISSLPSQP